MTKEDQEPVERLEEILSHPADKTYRSLHDQGMQRRKELVDDRQELGWLLSQLPSPLPNPGTLEYANYVQVQKQIQCLKEKVSKNHNELMEILKHEEKISREISTKDS
jgi:hypothetical protein